MLIVHPCLRISELFSLSQLSAETFSHYRMWRQGFPKERKWQSWPGQSTPFSVHEKKPRVGVDLIGEDLFHNFQSPTIFLKISCDGDFLLPIVVGIRMNFKHNQHGVLFCHCDCHFWTYLNRETLHICYCRGLCYSKTHRAPIGR